ncbi:MAG: MotA/TolQ/ExbB proton channel family protein [Bdellovibrionales bacterium]|nr:MotA/TolQ/ExbB proton channel family protein [Bdellovibrionales bacterium]
MLQNSPVIAALILATSVHDVFEILLQGGWVMLPLVGCSLIALAIVVERLIWGPSVERVLPQRFRQNALELARRGRTDELLGLCRGQDSAPARLLQIALQSLNRSEASLRQSIEAAGRAEALHLQRFVGVLGTIASVAPLLGLLGTVFGMIETFRVIQLQGVGNAANLAGGISAALITTATGLTIAIPTLVFYRFFLHRARRSIAALEQFCIDIIELLRSSASQEHPDSAVIRSSSHSG